MVTSENWMICCRPTTRRPSSYSVTISSVEFTRRPLPLPTKLAKEILERIETKDATDTAAHWDYGTAVEASIEANEGINILAITDAIKQKLNAA
jgi:hypothetical protein